MLLTWVLGAVIAISAPSFDRIVLLWLAEQRNDFLDEFFLSVTWVGSYYVLLPMLSLSVFALTLYRRYSDALFFTLALLGVSSATYAVKYWVARPRPDLIPSLITLPEDLSFPSGHATQITAFCLGAIWIARRLNRRWVSWLGAVAIALICVVCASRLYLQVHFPTDVLVGVLAACFWVGGLHYLFVAAKGQHYAT